MRISIDVFRWDTCNTSGYERTDYVVKNPPGFIDWQMNDTRDAPYPIIPSIINGTVSVNDISNTNSISKTFSGKSYELFTNIYSKDFIPLIVKVSHVPRSSETQIKYASRCRKVRTKQLKPPQAMGRDSFFIRHIRMSILIVYFPNKLESFWVSFHSLLIFNLLIFSSRYPTKKLVFACIHDAPPAPSRQTHEIEPVSYTHLTLPTKLAV